jgi:hypothetical protein
MVTPAPQFVPQPVEPAHPYESRFPDRDFADQQFRQPEFRAPQEFRPAPAFSPQREVPTPFGQKPPIENIKFAPERIPSPTFSPKLATQTFPQKVELPEPILVHPQIEEKEVAAKSLPSPKFEPKKLSDGFPEIMIGPKPIGKVIENIQDASKAFQPRLISEAFPKMAKLRTPDIVLHDSGRERARFWSGT